MLAIGRALVTNPRLLLLDEPTEGLAPIIIEELLAALTRLRREEGLASIIVEQHARKILGLTDKALILERGRIAHAAESAALLADPAPLERLLGITAMDNQQAAAPRTKETTHEEQTAISRRHGRQPAAPAGAEGCPRAARRREDHAGSLRQIEDAAIKSLVAKQEEVGLQAVTDGEFRRAFWHFDFLENLTGVEGIESEGIAFKGVTTKGHSIRVVNKIDFSEDHPHVAHFKYLASVTGKGKVPKMTIPSPSMLHYRGGKASINSTVYRDMDAYFSDLGKAYAKA